MSWTRPMDDALDATAEPTTVRIDGPEGAHAEVEVRRAGPIGVRVGRVRVRHGADRDVAAEAERLEREVRALPERLTPTEVDPRLGGAILRSRSSRPKARDFWEVRVDGPREVEVRRYALDARGDREPADFDLTREQLGRLLGELEGEGEG